MIRIRPFAFHFTIAACTGLLSFHAAAGQDRAGGAPSVSAGKPAPITSSRGAAAPKAAEHPQVPAPRRAEAAAEEGGIAVACPGTGSCFESHGTPGCQTADCCNAVCTVDPFCCNNSWDSLCASEAATICASCGGAGAGSCFVADGTPYCNDAQCCNLVCDADSFCCDNNWDSICATEANNMCLCGGSATGSCFEADGTPYCNDAQCCNLVCDSDPFCCDNSWDSLCATEATNMCLCGGSATGSCFVADGTPYCDNADCCDAVCAVDPFCCDNNWDSICANEATPICASCGGAGSGSCFIADGTPYCNLAYCCDAVCAVDSFCCNNNWDSICANEAVTICGCGGSATGNCFVSGPNPYCNNAECCDAVCDVDPFCCNNSWDGICASEATPICASCGGAGSGSCFVADGTPYCNDANCCNTVCGIDPFCCNTSWDSICANEAASMCAPCAGDISPTGGNDVVDIDDLFTVINSWGPCAGCPADVLPTGGDGQVNIDDLFFIINHWGACP